MISETDGMTDAPILIHKHYEAPSVLTPENMLRESRRQKGLAGERVPTICVLDPDGDLVDYLQATNLARRHPSWACFHTRLDTFTHEQVEYGIVGRVVGAPFAVLVAEELFAEGCELLISVTSAGQICFLGQPPYVVLIDQALRDEGTSYHYSPPSLYSYLNPALRARLCAQWDHAEVPLHVGTSWTTDAPFRETEQAIAARHEQGVLVVEMEAAALYALGSARQKQIVCFAYVTNRLGMAEGDFEKGAAQGVLTVLQMLQQTTQAWQNAW